MEPGLITYNKHVNECKSRTKQSRYLTLPTNPLVSPQAILGRHIMTQTDSVGSQFPGDEDRYGPQNVGLLAIQPPDVAVSPRIFYWMYVLIFCTPMAIDLPEGLNCTWEDNIKLHHKKIYCMHGNWIERMHGIIQYAVPVTKTCLPSRMPINCSERAMNKEVNLPSST